MTTIRFETCDRHRALGFLRKLYPSATVEDEGPVKDVLDFVERDVFRIPDPDFHSGAIMPSKNWKPENYDDAVPALQRMHAALTVAPAPSVEE